MHFLDLLYRILVLKQLLLFDLDKVVFRSGSPVLFLDSRPLADELRNVDLLHDAVSISSPLGLVGLCRQLLFLLDRVQNLRIQLVKVLK